MIDWTKPIELVDGTPAYYNGNSQAREGYHLVDIPSKPYTDLKHIVRVYTNEGVHDFGELPNIRNKELKMIDKSKPVQVNGKDAKIIHTFDNGNLAVVVEGMPTVYTFNKFGVVISGGRTGTALINTVEREEEFYNLYKREKPVPHLTLASARTGRSDGRGRFADFSGTIKVVWEDNKLVSVEIVDA